MDSYMTRYEETLIPRESRTLEYKEVINPLKSAEFKSYLKTVSAYANYTTGIILFGITDSRKIKGVDDPEQFCLDIERQINDSIQPVPEFSFEILKNNIVRLQVLKGRNTPYLYKNVAYFRRGSSSTPCGREQLLELSLKGSNLSYEDLPSMAENLSFDTLSAWQQEKIGTDIPIKDLLKSFQMYSDEEGYTNAALWLSDHNPVSGISIVQFGSSFDEIRFSQRLDHQSILSLYTDVCSLFNRIYSLEVIEGLERTLKFQIPEVAFREALANALVHRSWQSSADIQISFFPDRVTILSPGGLPEPLTANDYLNRMISMPRNMNLAIVFQRLGLIERFGTGIGRILKSYQNSIEQPYFEITDTSISVTLPFDQSISELSSNASLLLSLIQNGTYKKKKLIEQSGLNTYQVTKELRFLESKQLITKTGSTRNANFLPASAFRQNTDK